jgi:hypothetical protein
MILRVTEHLYEIWRNCDDLGLPSPKVADARRLPLFEAVKRKVHSAHLGSPARSPGGTDMVGGSHLREGVRGSTAMFMWR